MAADLTEPEVPQVSRPGRTGVWTVGLIGAVLALVAVGVVIVRSGDDDAGVVTEDPTLAGAAGATLATETARFSIRSGEHADVELEGVMSFGPEGRALITLYLEVDGSIDPAAEQAEMRAFPDRTYVSFDGRWISFTNEDFTEENGFHFATDQNPFLAMVSLFVESLDHAVPGTVETVGRETSHGEPVTVVRARIDFESTVRAVSVVDDDEVMAQLFDQFGSDLTVLLDDEGRARGVALTGGSENTFMEFWDFGVEVEVEVPATSSVWDESTSQGPDGTTSADVDVSESFCPLVDDVGGSVTTDDRTDDSAAWARSAARMDQIAAASPDEFVERTEDLADIYRSIAQVLADGAVFDDVIADGVQTDLGSLDWRTMTTIEEQVQSVHDLVCP